MDDVRAVRSRQSVGDLDPNLDRLPDRKGASLQPVGQRLPVEVLHHQEVDLAGAADIVDRADMRMIERGDRARFLLEATAAFGIGGQARRQDLDGDRAAKARVARLVNLAHPPGTDRRDDEVGAETLTDRDDRPGPWWMLERR